MVETNAAMRSTVSGSSLRRGGGGREAVRFVGGVTWVLVAWGVGKALVQQPVGGDKRRHAVHRQWLESEASLGWEGDTEVCGWGPLRLSGVGIRWWPGVRLCRSQLVEIHSAMRQIARACVEGCAFCRVHRERGRLIYPLNVSWRPIASTEPGASGSIQSRGARVSARSSSRRSCRGGGRG